MKKYPQNSSTGQPRKALTIGGSDSGGAAGIQADIKTFTYFGVYGMSVVTTVTAQNSQEIRDVHAVPDEVIVAQLDAVLSDYGADAVKTGFIGRAETIKAIAESLQSHKPPALIVDPVLVNHRGELMFPEEVIGAYVKYLLPIADLVTPNLAEALLFSGKPIRSVKDMETAARIIRDMGPRNVLIKRLHVKDDVIDLLVNEAIFTQFRSEWIDTENTHGSGDTLSAALCALLSQDLPLIDATERSLNFTRQAILNASQWQISHGHGPVWHQPYQE